MLSVAYVGSKNGRLPYSGLGIPPVRPQLIHVLQRCALQATFAAQVDSLRPMPGSVRGQLHARHWKGKLRALETKFQRRFTKGWSTLVAYTWGRSTDTGSGYFNVENGPAELDYSKYTKHCLDHSHIEIALRCRGSSQVYATSVLNPS